MNLSQSKFNTMPKVVLGLIVGAAAWMYFFGGDELWESIRQTYIGAQRWIADWTPF